MIAGEERPDDGLVSIDPGMTIDYFSQDVGEMSGQSAVAAVMDGVGPVSDLAAEMAQLEAAMVDPDRADDMDAIVGRGDAQQACHSEQDRSKPPSPDSQCWPQWPDPGGAHPRQVRLGLHDLSENSGS